MSNDMRIVKFEMMIREIFEDLGKTALTDNLGETVWNEGYGAAWLAVIYDYDKLNAYGKIIMEQVCEMTEEDETEDEEEFEHQIEFVENCEDMAYRMKAAKALVVKLNEEDNGGLINLGKPKKLFFIFWSLMVLAVDDAGKEKHLSLICDFAKMLKISDAEMMDIVQIIQIIYHIEGKINIQTKDVKMRFENVIGRYGVEYNNTTDSLEMGIMGSLLRGMIK
ncbi:MAG: hypothetical protein HFI47_01290 [Lachnospiraceae bacterium]|nr:hypothetical protein [Lachnospiraceae bacterium]